MVFVGVVEEVETDCGGQGTNHSCRGHESSLARVHGAPNMWWWRDAGEARRDWRGAARLGEGCEDSWRAGLSNWFARCYCDWATSSVAVLCECGAGECRVKGQKRVATRDARDEGGSRTHELAVKGDRGRGALRDAMPVVRVAALCSLCSLSAREG